MDRPSIEETIKWKKIIEENTDLGSEVRIPCLLVQNKSDLINNEKPEQHQTKKFLDDFARTNGFSGFLQCSAKENKNIEEVFQQLLGTLPSYSDETIKRGFVKNSSPIGKTSSTSNTNPSKSGKNDNIVLNPNNVSPSYDRREKKQCC